MGGLESLVGMSTEVTSSLERIGPKESVPRAPQGENRVVVCQLRWQHRSETVTFYLFHQPESTQTEFLCRPRLVSFVLFQCFRDHLLF